MRLRILQAMAWINIATGAFLACGGVLMTFAIFTSPPPDQPLYLSGLFALIPLCLALAFILTGRDFLKQPSLRNALAAASGFSVLVCLLTGSALKGIIPASVGGPLRGFILGVLVAYACFLLLKFFVIRPCFSRRQI